MQKEKFKYKSLTEWRQLYPDAYYYAKKNGWIKELREDFGWTNRKPDGYWTKERCIEDAKKYNNPTEWNKNSPSARDASDRHKCYNECISHMSKKRESNGFWTVEKCLIEAQKYSERKEWRAANRSSWSAAKRLGYYEICTSHMYTRKIKPRGYWTLKLCKEDALNFKSRFEWKKKSSGAYQFALKNGWLNECCQHMNYAKGTI